MDSLTPHGDIGPCVFVVEDHEDLREMLSDLLTVHGYLVFAFPTAEAALAALRAIRPLAILTDIALGGGMPGDELARRAHALDASIPVLATAGTEISLDGTPFDGAFLKPYDVDAIARVLGALAAAAA